MTATLHSLNLSPVGGKKRVIYWFISLKHFNATFQTDDGPQSGEHKIKPT